jgi:hypothetical protein
MELVSKEELEVQVDPKAKTPELEFVVRKKLEKIVFVEIGEREKQ